MISETMAKVLFLSFVCLALVAAAEATCEEYGLEEEASDCTSGFPSRDQVTGNTELKTADKRQVVIPAINFSCNGTITSWIIGAEWRDNDNPEGYIELQIWRGSSLDQFQKVNGTLVTVGSENESEVYEIETSMEFQEGDILGYFQPKKDKSRLNLYLENSGRITTHHDRLMGMPVTPPPAPVFDETDTKYPLIAVRTDPPDCGCGFMSEERVYALPQLQEFEFESDEFDNKQLIFPSISFTCTGQVTKWIVSGKYEMDEDHHPELQIWRPTGGNTYEKRGNATVQATSEEGDEVYEFPVDSPLPFQPGDILGLLQPNKDNSRLQVRYRNGGDSVYYDISADQSSSMFNISGNDGKMGTPLVTVEIQPSSSLLLSSSPIDLAIGVTVESSVSLTAMTSGVSQTLSITASVASSVVTTQRDLLISTRAINRSVGSEKKSSMMISTRVSSKTETALPSSTPPPVEMDPTKVQPSQSSPTENPSEVPSARDTAGSDGLGSGAVAGLAVGLSVVLLLGGLTATLSLILLHKKRQRKHKLKDTTVNVEMTNPNYGVAAAKYTKNAESTELYANPHDSQNDNQYALTDTAQHYETPLQSDSQQWDIYVPTMHERSLYQEVDDIYSYAGLKPVVKNGNGVPDQESSTFFTESDIYWVPASDTAGLYEQLSRNHFREIQRDCVEIKEHLGSGQFGVVCKGVWQFPGGKKEVAIKLLQAGAPEDSRVKFLKEAAIMGQFSHRNVISLHGVVTLGEPVMIMMELMSGGDLRDNLIGMRPTPGELLPHSLSQQLLDYCHQTSAGMKYLSDKSFVHRDLAARNILVSGKTCKIADFGMARDLEESNYYISQGGQIPVKWTAPEALHYKKYSTASDVWSFGCLMYEIWSLGHKPFEGYTNVQAIHVVQSGCRLAPPPGCPREIYKLMIFCWHPKTANRPNFSQLLQTLSQSEHDLLNIPEEVTKGHPQASVLGAPLEAGSATYTDLQTSYVT